MLFRSNIIIQPDDVISVPRTEMVYVMGEVKTPGGIPLSERQTITVLQAVSMAQGLLRGSAPKNAKILRSVGLSTERVEERIDVRAILSGKMPDIPLGADDILFIPGSSGRSAALRMAEVAAQVGSGVTVALVAYRR